MILGDFFSAFQAGKVLSNATTWKHTQVVVAKLSILLSAAVGILGVFGYAIPLTPEQIGILAGAVGVVVGLFNGTATVVSTTRVGLSPRSDAVPDGRPIPEHDRSGTGTTEDTDRRSDGMAGSDSGIDDEVPYLRDTHRG